MFQKFNSNFAYITFFFFVQGKNVMFKENETRYETIIQIVTTKPFAVDRLKSLCCP